LKQAAVRLPLGAAVSVACGAGYKEMQLISQGLVESFDLFEISDVRVTQGEQRAREMGIADRIRYYNHPPRFDETERQYSLVYWNNALHHMFDVREAVTWSRKILELGGIFYMNDYVGSGTDLRSRLRNIFATIFQSFASKMGSGAI
jgi:hypothetical protein